MNSRIDIRWNICSPVRDRVVKLRQIGSCYRCR